MKTRTLLTLTSAIAAVLLAGVHGLHATQVVAVSVNFTGNGGGGIDNGQATSLTNLVMDPTGANVEKAGAPGFAATNWNNLDRWGDVTSGIIDYAGNASGLHINWDAAGNANSGSASLGTPDGRMMDGMDWVTWQNAAYSGPVTANNVYGASGSQKPLIYVGGIQSWLAAHGQGATSYTVVMYVQGHYSWDGTPNRSYVQAVTSGNPSSSSMVPGPVVTPALFYRDTGTFNGTYTQVASTCTNSANTSQGGNYVVFSGLTNDAILLVHGMDSADYNAGTVMGFQIVATVPVALTVGTPTASVASPVPQGTTDTLSATISGGTAPYTYQWRTDGASGGSLTNIPNATNATFSVATSGLTPAINYSYSLVVTDSVLATATSAPVVVNVYQILPTSIGVHFTSNGSGTGADALAVTDSAGAPGYAQTNWNNFAKSGSGVVVTNSGGHPTSLFINWDSEAVGSSTGASDATPDGRLMDGNDHPYGGGSQAPLTNSANVYGQAGNQKPLIYISGIRSWLNAMAAVTNVEGYGVVEYVSRDLNSPTVEGFIESVTGSPTNNTMVEGVSLAPHKYAAVNTSFSGTYVEATATNSGSATSGANYMFVGASTNDAILIRLQTGYLGGLNGFQLVPIFPTAPTASAPTFSPGSPVYSGVPVTVAEAATGDPIHTALYYQWLTDGGSGGALTNMPNATNLTVTVTPPGGGAISYNIQFQVIVTNFVGSVTSSVSILTVDPGAPVVNSNTSPSGNVYAYVNGSLTFTANFNGSEPFVYQWLSSSSYPLTGATNTTLVLTNLQTSADGTYQLLVTNALGNSASSAATLTVLDDPAAPDVSTAYPYAVFTNGPVAYWRFNETIDNTLNTIQAYDYSGNKHNATYGTGAYDVTPGYNGPLPSGGYPGFESTNGSVTLLNNVANSSLIAPDLNLNTNTVTITAWINPNTAIGGNWGLFMWRGTNGDGAGFGFGSTVSGSMAELGYTWNSNSASTYNFHSGLYAPFNQWSFVALTITPTNTSIYLYYVDGSSVTHLSKSVQTINNSPEAFSGGTTWIGSDSYSGRNFNGSIDEMAVFNRSLSETDLQGLFSAGSGVTGVVPYITSDTSANPANYSNYFPGQVPAVQLTAAGSGMPVPAYLWQAGTGGVFTNLVDGGSFAGSGSGTLTINPVTPATYLDYRLLLTNVNGSATSLVYTVSQPIGPTNGLWTARFQATPTQWGQPAASGRFTGLGVLGSGTYWNSVPANGWGNSGTWSSATSYQDNGSTNSGITCTLQGGSNASSGPYATNDVRGLLSQVIGVFGTDYTTNSIGLANMPNGYYNIAIHGACGGWNDRGATFRVHGMNGDQIAGTTNTPQFALYQNYVTTVLFTNVEVTNGILNVDVEPTPIVPSHNPNTEGYYNAVEVQLVSYGLPTVAFSGTPTTGAAPLAVVFTNTTIGSVTNSAWNFGDGNTAAMASTANVTNTYATAGSYTVSLVVAGLGGVGTLTNTAYIVVTNAVAAAPVAGFSGTPTNLFVTQSVAFTDASTGSITNWAWNFGDSSSVTNTSNAGVNHTYASAGTYTVSLTVTGAGGSSTNTKTGYIAVLSKPAIGSAKMSGGSMVLGGSGGTPGQQYRILNSTNAALPLASWMPVWTNVFASDGSYSYTNSSPTNDAGFFILTTP